MEKGVRDDLIQLMEVGACAPSADCWAASVPALRLARAHCAGYAIWQPPWWFAARTVCSKQIARFLIQQLQLEALHG